MLARIVILIIAPPALIWAFLSTLWHEVKDAPWYAWNECCIEMDSIRAAWIKKSIRPEDWT